MSDARVFCLDLATMTGWAFVDLADRDAQPECGRWDLSAPWGNTRPAKIDSFSYRMGEVLEERRPTMLAVEAPLVPNHGAAGRFDVNALMTSWGLFTHSELIARRHGLSFRSINTTEIKKIATGHGARWKQPDGSWKSPDKHLVLEGMKARWPGITPDDHNVADALAIGTLMIAERWGSGSPAVKPSIKIPPRKTRGRRPTK